MRVVVLRSDGSYRVAEVACGSLQMRYGGVRSLIVHTSATHPERLRRVRLEHAWSLPERRDSRRHKAGGGNEYRIGDRVRSTGGSSLLQLIGKEYSSLDVKNVGTRKMWVSFYRNSSQDLNLDWHDPNPNAVVTWAGRLGPTKIRRDPKNDQPINKRHYDPFDPKTGQPLDSKQIFDDAYEYRENPDGTPVCEPRYDQQRQKLVCSTVYVYESCKNKFCVIIRPKLLEPGGPKVKLEYDRSFGDTWLIWRYEGDPERKTVLTPDEFAKIDHDHKRKVSYLQTFRTIEIK